MDSPSPPAATLRRALLDHFDARARDLPWRRTADPYAIWVSEVMLQQTRVDTVIPYYRRWMERYPTVEALADAELDAVLKSWEGLGYYRRARMLHRAAVEVRDRHAGRLPSSAAMLRELPGVGEYTAGAVASIAFDRVTPAVDGNVRRVLSRMFDLPRPTPTELRDLAGTLLDPERPGDFNQAVMELGATVCTPRSPLCGECPWRGPCRARRDGTQEVRPLPRARKAVPEVDVGVAVLTRKPGKRAVELFLVRRPEEGMLGGLWEFPGTEARPGESGAAAAARALLLSGEAAGTGARALPTVSHVFTHLRATYHPFLYLVDGGEPAGPGPRTAAGWFGPAELARLAVPVAQQRILESVREALGGGG